MSATRKPSFRKCVIRSCGTTSFDTSGPRLIKFPTYGSERFYNWLTNIKVQLLEGNHYICSRHFLNIYLGSNGNHLCTNAIPTENLDFVKDPKPQVVKTYGRQTLQSKQICKYLTIA